MANCVLCQRKPQVEPEKRRYPLELETWLMCGDCALVAVGPTWFDLPLDSPRRLGLVAEGRGLEEVG